MMNEQKFYKEIEAHFNLRTNKSKKPEMVYLVVRIDGRQYKLSSGVKVYPQQWRKGVAEESNFLCKRDNKNNKIVNEKLTVLKKRYSEFISYLCNCDNEITDMGDLLKQFIYKDMDIKNKEKSVDVCKLIQDAFNEYYETNKPNTKESSINQSRSFLKVYVSFLESLSKENQKLAFCKEGFLKWRDFLLKKMRDSADKKIKFGFKQVNAYGQLIQNLINEVLYQKSNLGIKVEVVKWAKLKDTREKQDIGHFELYQDELDAIFNLLFDESKKSEKKKIDFRELFRLQTLCGLRVSDLHTLIEGNYLVEEHEIDGKINKFYLVETEKKNLKAYVLVTEELSNTLNYVRNSSAKNFRESSYNYNLKSFCKMANLDRTITRKDSLGKSVSKPLYEVVSTHCARYTFIRSMWKKGYTEMAVAKMVGHTDDTMVKEIYNKKTDGDYMDMISKGKEKVEHTQETVSIKPKKKTYVINGFFAYDDIEALMDMQQSGISIYNDARLKKAMTIIKKSVSSSTMDKVIKMRKDADKATIEAFKEKVCSIERFIWDMGKYFADTKLYMMYQYKLNKLGLLSTKPFTEEELDMIWQQELANEELEYYNANGLQ